MRITDSIIKIVNGYSFDLIHWSNDVILSIEWTTAGIDDVIKRIKEVIGKDLFDEKRMMRLGKIVLGATKLSGIHITSKKYLSGISDISFFTTGQMSSAIFFKVTRGETKYISKVVPLQLPHTYQSIKSDTKYIWNNVESLNYATFLKESWMCCFSQQHLSKYTPCFACIGNCYIIKGLPVSSVDSFKKMVIEYDISNTFPIKRKWVNEILSPISETSKELYQSVYGCIESIEIEKTLYSLILAEKIDLAIIFECFYTKMIAAFVGRIILIDDHLDNIGYIIVDYSRVYNIKCNGSNYRFVMPPGKMSQFIDLERYLFNYSDQDTYSNKALRTIPINPNNKAQVNLRKNHSLIRIWDFVPKDVLSSNFLSPFVNENNFEDPEEYGIMIQILDNLFTNNVKYFPQIMDTLMPEKYRKDPVGKSVTYHIDLDDNGLRVIALDQVLRNN